MSSRMFAVSRDDWSLHRTGHMDQQRHKEKVKEAIRNNLADLVAEESIILSDGQTVIKVPIRSLEEYRFRYDPDRRSRIGQGDGNTRQGETIGRAAAGPGHGSGGGGAGDMPGVDYYEAEITVDELADLIFADLGLPNLKPKGRPEMQQDAPRFDDVRRHGAMSNLDRRRTLKEAIKRSQRSAVRLSITRDDLRFKTWQEHRETHASAVVLAMMDTSGSMGAFEKYVARSFFFWMVRFLRTRYRTVQIVFLAHDSRAREVSKQEFFTKGESGGTRCSSVYELALSIAGERYPPEEHNVYAFHFSDGDNLPSDNDRCVELVGRLLSHCAAVGYAEVAAHRSSAGSTLRSALSSIEDPRFTCVTIRDKSDVYPALKAFFHGGPPQGPG
ncbi:MAG: sporulation protein YhbH [Firmicutes bacterium]|nr:sporulation protein YhbH [Bacillota bacterium]